MYLVAIEYDLSNVKFNPLGTSSSDEDTRIVISLSSHRDDMKNFLGPTNVLCTLSEKHAGN